MAAHSKKQPGLPPLVTGRLACGCQIGFRAGVEGSPVAIVLDRKSPACAMSIHVAGLPIHDHREALRPSTRFAPPIHSDYEES
jgi:hypothetical protein